MPDMITRRSILAASAAAGLCAPPIVRRGWASEPTIGIGCLTDLSGPYADLVGKGVTGSVNLAIEDFHRSHRTSRSIWSSPISP